MNENSLKQKIRQKGKSIFELQKEINRRLESDPKALTVSLHDYKWVRVDDVVAVLDEVTKQIQDFKVLNEGTSETNASCCCHFEDCKDYECPLKKYLLAVLDGEHKK